MLTKERSPSTSFTKLRNVEMKSKKRIQYLNNHSHAISSVLFSMISITLQ